MSGNESVSLQTEEDIEMKNQMEKMVDTYDAYMKKTTWGREKALREMTVNLAQIEPGDSVLEIGCATGSLTLEAKRKTGASGRVCGIDIIPGMIEYSRKKAEAAKLDVEFKAGSIESIPFPDKSFDVVMCSFMIFHMSEPVRQKGIREISRVLKPNGVLLIIDLALPRNPVSRVLVKALLGFMFQHDLKELLPVMESSGFTKLESSRVKFRIFGISLISFIRGRKST